VILLILGMPKPVSAGWIAKRLNLEYSHTKRAVRSLVAWKILQRSAEGLVFQPDYRLWERPAA
jgi:predicted transcriptional regulator